MSSAHRKIRFALIVTRQVLAVIEALAFPRESAGSEYRPSPRVALVVRIMRLGMPALAIWAAWRDVNRPPPQPRRKTVGKKAPRPERRQERVPRPRARGDA